MLGRARIAHPKTEATQTAIIFFTDAADQNQNDLMDEADSERKSPCGWRQFGPKTPLQIETIKPKYPKTRPNQIETSMNKADSDQKDSPQTRLGSDRKTSYR